MPPTDLADERARSSPLLFGQPRVNSFNKLLGGRSRKVCEIDGLDLREWRIAEDFFINRDAQHLEMVRYRVTVDKSHGVSKMRDEESLHQQKQVFLADPRIALQVPETFKIGLGRVSRIINLDQLSQAYPLQTGVTGQGPVLGHCRDLTLPELP